MSDLDVREIIIFSINVIQHLNIRPCNWNVIKHFQFSDIDVLKFVLYITWIQ